MALVHEELCRLVVSMFASTYGSKVQRNVLWYWQSMMWALGWAEVCVCEWVGVVVVWVWMHEVVV